jgi:AmiR/NasT family two-component response regulator
VDAGPRLDADEPLTRLVLAQPYTPICDALEHLLEAAGLEVIGRCGDVADLEECLRRLEPDISLVDADMAADGHVEWLLRPAWAVAG